MTQKIWTDEGAGVTSESLKLFRSMKGKLGEIYSIHICAGLDFGFQIFCENGWLLLSGCSCGYGGEGPHGSVQILRELGMNDIELGFNQRMIFSQTYVTVMFTKGDLKW